MLTNVLELKTSPTRVRRNGLADLSILERRFSRIAQELAARWSHKDIDTYLDSLLLDDRGDRQGFPPEILEELMFLSNLRWQLLHPRYTRADEALVEQFTFSPAAQLDAKYCEPKHN